VLAAGVLGRAFHLLWRCLPGLEQFWVYAPNRAIDVGRGAPRKTVNHEAAVSVAQRERGVVILMRGTWHDIIAVAALFDFGAGKPFGDAGCDAHAAPSS
jgi:hypothetical protein